MYANYGQASMSEILHCISEGYISVEDHPDGDLSIFNYTAKAVYQRYWNPATLMCRGLILNRNCEVVARPFRKFFNLKDVRWRTKGSEYRGKETFEVYDKLDGSLGILYLSKAGFAIATRGSFVSEQAKRATQMLSRYRKDLIDPSFTFLFEIIYPENRIVCDYKQREELVLLAAIERETGREIPYKDLHNYGFPVVERLAECARIEDLYDFERPGTEGFVLRFLDGSRAKVKTEEYSRLHHLLTGIRPSHIWEALKGGVLKISDSPNIPEDFRMWARDIEHGLEVEFNKIVKICRDEFRAEFGSRKEAADYFRKCQYPSVMFSLYDGKPYDESIWRMIRPKFGRAFRCDNK